MIPCSIIPSFTCNQQLMFSLKERTLNFANAILVFMASHASTWDVILIHVKIMVFVNVRITHSSVPVSQDTLGSYARCHVPQVCCGFWLTKLCIKLSRSIQSYFEVTSMYQNLISFLCCSLDKFGPDCNQTCFCQGRSRCHPVTGKCTCDAGFTGRMCDTSCDSDHFGKNCEQVCKCSSRTVCDPKTGSCYCPIGYYGEFCENRCKIGFYGRNCTTP